MQGVGDELWDVWFVKKGSVWCNWIANHRSVRQDMVERPGVACIEYGN